MAEQTIYTMVIGSFDILDQPPPLVKRCLIKNVVPSWTSIILAWRQTKFGAFDKSIFMKQFLISELIAKVK